MREQKDTKLRDRKRLYHPRFGIRMLRSESGIALVMILILAAIALVIIAGLIYMVTSTTQISGMQKRYRTALDAGKGAVDVTYQFIAARGNPSMPGINFYLSSSNSCLIAKLNSSTSAANWTPCIDYGKTTSLSIDRTDPLTYDFRFDLKDDPVLPTITYRSYAKIVNTVEGNSGGDEGLIGKGVVASGSGEIAVMSIPYLYAIEVESENLDHPSERAKLSVLYQY